MTTTIYDPEGSIFLKGCDIESASGHTEDSKEYILTASPIEENKNKTETQKTVILKIVESEFNAFKPKKEKIEKYQIEVDKLIRFITSNGIKIE